MLELSTNLFFNDRMMIIDIFDIFGVISSHE